MVSFFIKWALRVGIFGVSAIALAEPCGNEFACHEALVKFSRHADSIRIEEILQQNQLQVLDYFAKTRLYLVGFPENKNTAALFEALLGQEGILQVIPNYRVTAEALPNDPSFGELWGMHNTGQAGGVPGADIGLEDVWSDFNHCEDVLIATIDSGVDYTHPDLAENIWVNPGEVPDNGLDDDHNGYVDDVHGYDFYHNHGDPMDESSHGTHIAGTIGASGNNGTGVAGVCWRSRIMALKFLGPSGSGFVSDAIRALEYSIMMGAKVLNNSWGTSANDPQLYGVLLASDQAGQVFVVAAGNQSQDLDSDPFFPAAYDTPNVVSVASVDRFNQLSSFSNFGRITVDLGAPGSQIYSTLPVGMSSYGNKSGTSMSVPHVVGAAALLWSAFPHFNHRQVKDFLLQGVTANPDLSGNSVSGGTLNVSNSRFLMAGVNNLPPSANAGADQFKKVGESVVLHGSGTDPDPQGPLSFFWALQRPSGSTAQLDNPTAANPQFVPDREGTYQAVLVVSDTYSSSLPDNAMIQVNGDVLPPPSIVLRAQTAGAQGSVDLDTGTIVETGERVFFDAGETTAFFPENLIFEWYWLARPEGSLAILNNTNQAQTSFVPDMPGTYTVGLTVEDGFHESSGELSVVASDNPNPIQDPAQPATGGGGGCSLQK